MGADATLVNMAYHAAMAKKPGDWSRSFDKQYEGIIAANQALVNIGSGAIGAGKEITSAYIKRRKAEGIKTGEVFKGVLEARTLDEITNGAADTLIKNTAAEYTYKNGEGLNPAIRDAAYSVPTDIHNNITKRNKKVFQTKKDKQYIAEQYSRLESWKSDRIRDKANIKTLVDFINTDGINLELMDPEYKALLAQLINNKDDLSAKGIRIYNRKRITDDDAPFEYPAIQPYSTETAQKVGLQTVSFDDLMGNIQKRELELQGDLVEVVGGASAMASATHAKSKAFITAEWDDGSVNSGKAQITRSVNNLFAGKGRKEIADLATTDFFGTNTTYRKDLTDWINNLELEELEYYDYLDSMGIEDKGEPGYKDDYYARGDLIKEEIVGRLINPKTPSDEKVALSTIKEYYINMAHSIFNTTRTALVNEQNEIKNRASGKTGTTETTPKTVDLPWQKGLKEPTNIQARASHDLVQEILNEQGEVKDGNDVYTRQKDGTYKLTHEISGGKRSPISGGEVRTKVSMIQLGGGIYGNIPDDYFDIMFIDTDPENPSTLVTPDIETSKYLEDLKKSKNIDASKL